MEVLPKDVLIYLMLHHCRPDDVRAMCCCCKRLNEVVAASAALTTKKTVPRWQKGSLKTEGLDRCSLPDRWWERTGRYSVSLRLGDEDSLAAYTYLGIDVTDAFVRSGALLAFYGDGDVWTRNQHASYQDGFPNGCHEQGFESGMVLRLELYWSEVTAFPPGPYYRVRSRASPAELPEPNLAVVFSVDGRPRHRTWLLHVADPALVRLVYAPRRSEPAVLLVRHQ